jgi:hypothetical protein
MTQEKAVRTYSKMDFVIVIGSMLLATWLVSAWMPASQGDDEAMIAFRLFSGLASLGLVFMVMCVYGIWRFVQKGRRALVAALVALPALYGGLVVGGLRNGAGNTQEVPMADAVRVQDGLAALWWGRQAATELPSWARGGMEFWPTASGDMAVETTQTHVSVTLLDAASPRECQRLVGDLSEQKKTLNTIGGWLSINGKKVADGDGILRACGNGGIVSLSASLPKHE